MSSVEDYRWLVSDDGARWLARARDDLAAAGGQVTVALVQSLRKDLPAERAHLVCEQLELRERAREKFTRADQMFFTRKGLEQATDEALARYKADRFPAVGECFDLCTGIGGDLVALGARLQVTGVDADAVCALLAQRNAAVYGQRNSRLLNVRVEDVLGSIRADGGKLSAWHLDPDRRTVGKRTTTLAAFEPGLATIAELLAVAPSGAIKVAPASDVPVEWNHAERQWTESRGECRQQVVWFGELAQWPGQRVATVVDATGGAATIVGSGGESLPVASALGRFLYEPRAAVLAARLEGELAARHQLGAVAPRVAYLTGETELRDPLLDGFEVHDVLPLDRKQLRAYCRERGIGRLEIKKRGLDIEPEKLRREIVAAGDAAATVLLAPVGGAAKAIIARRLE
ncbi:MAG: hypothetical protein SFU86_22855 [Pirellulaceae bacterium]|nr:hypothetical protein [Pirellulaceae bacterium]